jgi:hypothetical protein
MERDHCPNNNYYVSLGRRLKIKSEEYRNTVSLNAKRDPIDLLTKGPSVESIREYKMKLIYPNKIEARGVNKKVFEVLQRKESKFSLFINNRLGKISKQNVQ